MANLNIDGEQQVRQILNIANQSLDESSACKQALLNNPYRSVLFDVLCGMKSNIAAINMNETKSDGSSPADHEMKRLDNFLAIEGVTTATSLSCPGLHNFANAPENDFDQNSGIVEQNVNTDHAEYQAKLAQVRQFYADEYERYIEQRDIIISHATILLNEHSKLRPVSAEEQHRLIRLMQHKCNLMPSKLKQTTCEMVMQLRTRLLDARRKRRNFGKQATQILNQYFNAHLEYPYPTEEEKDQLAQQCNVTPAQVSNWFGNKRIRYKKNLGKDQSEAQCAAQASSSKRSAEDVKSCSKRSRNE